MGTIKWLDHSGSIKVEEADKAPALAKLQEFVGGYIELVNVLGEDGKAHQMIVNEEGLLRGLPVNPEASLHYARNSLKQWGEYPPTAIHGNAVFLDGLALD